MKEEIDRVIKLFNMSRKLSEMQKELDSVIEELTNILAQEEDTEKSDKMLQLLFNNVQTSLIMHKSTLDTFYNIQVGKE